MNSFELDKFLQNLDNQLGDQETVNKDYNSSPTGQDIANNAVTFNPDRNFLVDFFKRVNDENSIIYVVNDNVVNIFIIDLLTNNLFDYFEKSNFQVLQQPIPVKTLLGTQISAIKILLPKQYSHLNNKINIYIPFTVTNMLALYNEEELREMFQSHYDEIYELISKLFLPRSTTDDKKTSALKGTTSTSNLLRVGGLLFSLGSHMYAAHVTKEEVQRVPVGWFRRKIVWPIKDTLRKFTYWILNTNSVEMANCAKYSKTARFLYRLLEKQHPAYEHIYNLNKARMENIGAMLHILADTIDIAKTKYKMPTHNHNRELMLQEIYSAYLSNNEKEIRRVAAKYNIDVQDVINIGNKLHQQAALNQSFVQKTSSDIRNLRNFIKRKLANTNTDTLDPALANLKVIDTAGNVFNYVNQRLSANFQDLVREKREMIKPAVYSIVSTILGKKYLFEKPTGLKRIIYLPFSPLHKKIMGEIIETASNEITDMASSFLTIIHLLEESKTRNRGYDLNKFVDKIAPRYTSRFLRK